MNLLVQKFYELGGESQLHEVMLLNQEKSIEWDAISEKVPDLPRGWFELSRVSREERIEFITDLWLGKLPFHPGAYPSFVRFFSRLEDVGIFIVRREEGYEAEMAYSLGDNSSFFRGFPPVVEPDIQALEMEIGKRLPRDYLAFLQIHNGLGKLSETGILPVESIAEAKKEIKALCSSKSKTLQSQGRNVDPESLIPFYENFGFNSFQCFFSEWYPGSEMGNVYVSGMNYALSNLKDRSAWAEELAFPSFSEWLALYLEGLNVDWG